MCFTKKIINTNLRQDLLHIRALLSGEFLLNEPINLKPYFFNKHRAEIPEILFLFSIFAFLLSRASRFDYFSGKNSSMN
jgi:hypothetical protein